MGFTISHRILFELNIWNHFFLDKGRDNFVELGPNEKLRQISRYDVHRFFDIRLTTSCIKRLAGHQLKLKKTPSGLLVGVKENEDGDKPWIPFDGQMKLTFVLTVIDPEFYNYSDLSLEAGIHPVHPTSPSANPHIRLPGACLRCGGRERPGA